MFKREPRYVVIKGTDMQCLTEKEQRTLAVLLGKTVEYREGVGKAPLDVFVLERDWPEFDIAVDMVRRRMEGLPSREAEFEDYKSKADAVIRELKERLNLHGEVLAMGARQPGMQTIRDLAILVALLSRAVTNSGTRGICEANKDTARKAMDYLKRKGLQGSPFRAADAPDEDLHQDMRTVLHGAITDALGDAYDCTRVWSAWGCGTMTEDDFTLIKEDSDRMSELVDAAFEVVQPMADEIDRLNALLKATTQTPDKAAFEKVAVEFYYWWHNQPGNNTAEGFNKWWASREAQAPSDLTQTKSPLTPKHLIGLMQIGLNLSPEAVQRVQATIDRWELKPAPAWRKEPPEAAGVWWYWNCDPEDRPMKVDVVLKWSSREDDYQDYQRPYIPRLCNWADNIKGGMWLREIEPTVPVLEGKADAKTNA